MIVWQYGSGGVFLNRSLQEVLSVQEGHPAGDKVWRLFEITVRHEAGGPQLEQGDR